LSSELYTDINGNQIDGIQRKPTLNDLDIYGDLKYLEFEKLFNAGRVDLASSLVVYVDSTKANMNKLTLSIINYNSIHIEGDLGCGKTTLVSNLAQLTGNKLIKYQMDDYMDSKVSKPDFIKTPRI
jgi:midasin (ATPase involved in ribosome maturation)